jgi:hypothetical protein
MMAPNQFVLLISNESQACTTVSWEHFVVGPEHGTFRIGNGSKTVYANSWKEILFDLMKLDPAQGLAFPIAD